MVPEVEERGAAPFVLYCCAAVLDRFLSLSLSLSLSSWNARKPDQFLA
jgi:hypothetical protein